MIEQNIEHRNFKIAVDIAAGIFVIVFLACPWMALTTPISHIMFIINTYLIDGIPFVFGLVWLEVRYRDFLQKYFPIYRRWHLRFVVLFLCLFVPIVVMIHKK